MLTLQFVPHTEISNLSSVKRIHKLLSIVKSNRVILLEGKLKPHEEAELIRKTMEEIDDDFRGIEISAFNPETKDDAFTTKVRNSLITMLLGDRKGLTIIGPASVIKEIKNDPEKMQLFTQDDRKQ